MALTLAQLNTRLDVLKAVRFSPQEEIAFPDGTRVRYRSEADLANAIAALEAEIAEAEGTRQPRYLRTSLRNGYL